MSQCFCCVVIPQDKRGVIETCGKFERIANPGISPACCCAGTILAGTVPTRIMQLDVPCETKTKDNVFVQVIVAVQYVVKQEQSFDAYYKLSNPSQQIMSHVENVVRSEVPKIILDDVFDQKEQIASAIKGDLEEKMTSYGYDICDALVRDINPDQKVKNAMNEINAAQRQRQAANDKAEADKIIVVKAAEADAESKYLAGVGIARQRQAIIKGLQDSVESFTEGVSDVTPKDVLSLMLMTQYFDAMRDMAADGSNTVFVPHGPGAVGDIDGQLRNAFLQASAGSPSPSVAKR